jgi:hypothetical protein
VSDIGQPYATSGVDARGSFQPVIIWGSHTHCEQLRILHSTAAAIALGRDWRAWIKVRFPIERGAKAEIGARLADDWWKGGIPGPHVWGCMEVCRMPSRTCRQGCRSSEARWHEEMRLRASVWERQGATGNIGELMPEERA